MKDADGEQARAARGVRELGKGLGPVLGLVERVGQTERVGDRVSADGEEVLRAPELDSDEAVVRYVLANPGALGYVSTNAKVQNAKVLSVR